MNVYVSGVERVDARDDDGVRGVRERIRDEGGIYKCGECVVGWM